MKPIYFIFLLFIVLSESAWASGGSQTNLNFGFNKPLKDDGHSAGLMRFQLQKEPSLFSPLTSFSGVVGGSSVMLGEFSLGASSYFLSSFAQNSKMLPFIGAEGIAAIGKREDKTGVGGGYGIFSGVDLRTFSNRSGITLNFELYKVSETGFRVWIGFFSIRGM